MDKLGGANEVFTISHATEQRQREQDLVMATVEFQLTIVLQVFSYWYAESFSYDKILLTLPGVVGWISWFGYTGSVNYRLVEICKGVL